MSRLLTPQELEALLQAGPVVSAPVERVHIVVEAGRTDLPFAELEQMRPGALLPLNGAAGDPVEIIANGTTVAYGQLVTERGRACVRVTALANRGSQSPRRTR